jgi:hypothetical protein
MRWSLSRLRPLHIALASVAYWVGLTAVKLGSAILAGWWVSRLPTGHGSVSAGFQNLLLHLTIAQDGKTLWTGSTSLPALAVWVIGPPLLLALTWRWSREVEAAGDVAQERGDSGPADEAAPPLPPPPIRWPAGRTPEPDTTRIVHPRRQGTDPTTPPGGRAR